MTEFVMSLAIGVLGYTPMLTDQCISLLAKENQEDVASLHRGRLYLKDETKIFAIYSENSIRGRYIDQLIVCDRDTYYKHCDLIDYVKMVAMSRSCVPEEFKILDFEY